VRLSFEFSTRTHTANQTLTIALIMSTGNVTGVVPDDSVWNDRDEEYSAGKEGMSIVLIYFFISFLSSLYLFCSIGDTYMLTLLTLLKQTSRMLFETPQRKISDALVKANT
jgi:hypothetical protein